MKIVMGMIVLTLTAAISGCVTSKPLYTAEGQPGFAITCSGHRNSWSDCLAEAGQKCREQGFTVLERNGEAVPVEFHDYNATSDVHAKLFSYSEKDQVNATDYKGLAIHRSIVVACGHRQSNN